MLKHRNKNATWAKQIWPSQKERVAAASFAEKRSRVISANRFLQRTPSSIRAWIACLYLHFCASTESARKRGANFFRTQCSLARHSRAGLLHSLSYTFSFLKGDMIVGTNYCKIFALRQAHALLFIGAFSGAASLLGCGWSFARWLVGSPMVTNRIDSCWIGRSRICAHGHWMWPVVSRATEQQGAFALLSLRHHVPCALALCPSRQYSHTHTTRELLCAACKLS